MIPANPRHPPNSTNSRKRRLPPPLPSALSSAVTTDIDAFALLPDWWHSRTPHEIFYLDDENDNNDDTDKHKQDKQDKPTLTPCTSLAMARRFLRLGVPEIDYALRPGIPSGTLFEVA